MIYQVSLMILWVALCFGTYFLARKDIETHRVPNKACLGIAIGSIATIVLECLIPGAVVWKVILSHLGGGLAAFGIMIAAGLYSKGGFGGGDIKLMGAIGLCFSFYYSMLITVLSAAMYLGYTVLIRKKHAKIGTEAPKILPYVPFVFLATAVTTLVATIPMY